MSQSRQLTLSLAGKKCDVRILTHAEVTIDGNLAYLVAIQKKVCKSDGGIYEYQSLGFVFRLFFFIIIFYNKDLKCFYQFSIRKK